MKILNSIINFSIYHHSQQSLKAGNYAEYLAKKMNKKIEFTDMKFASLVPTLQSGRAEVIISAISPTDERMKVVDFSKP